LAGKDTASDCGIVLFIIEIVALCNLEFCVRILITTPYFHPSVGGVETMALTLASAFSEQGHEVVLATLTPDLHETNFSFRVVRNPSVRALWALTRSSDVVLQNHISLRLGWAAFLTHRPMVIAHHMWTARTGKGALRGKFKHWLCGLARNVGVSRAIAQTLPQPATVIPNPYRDDLFRRQPEVTRDRDLVYLGRLIEGKGAHRAIEAVAILKAHGHLQRLSIVGHGPAESSLRQRVQDLQLSDLVEFTGVLREEALVQFLNRHRILLVPSIWEEPFGLVALEGMACGLVVIGTDVGGLPEAIGDAGVIVRADDPVALADAIEHLLRHPEEVRKYEPLAEVHLSAHRREVIAAQYLRELELCRSPRERRSSG
jgi:glycosyltransferase involved in cell wall biosynthesis